MSRNSYSTLAVAGVGALGQHISRELLAVPGVHVLGLSRSAPRVTVEGLDVRTVDYTQPSNIIDVLRGVDVLISTLSGDGYALQSVLADAAKSAGVKLFVPSEFGMPTENVPIGTLGGLGEKAKLHKHLETIGLPYTRFYTGSWSDMIFAPFFGYDLKNRRVKLAGDGSAHQTFTSEFDVAVYVAYVLTHLDLDALAWSTFRLEGETLSNREVVRKIEAFLGGEVQIEWENVADLKATIEREGPANAHGKVLRVLWAEGYGAVGKSDNGLVPGWKPLTVDEALRKFYS